MIAAFGPVELIVVNDSPRKRSCLLNKCIPNQLSIANDVLRNSRSVFLQLVGTLALCQLDALVELLLQPSKVRYECSSISLNTAVSIWSESRKDRESAQYGIA